MCANAGYDKEEWQAALEAYHIRNKVSLEKQHEKQQEKQAAVREAERIVEQQPVLVN